MRRKRSQQDIAASKGSSTQELSTTNCYEGEHLAALLKRLEREIESTKLLTRTLPEKIWIKQQFAIGVNDVTRVLERMAGSEVGSHSQEHVSISSPRKAPLVPLQAVLLASDCNPRWLTKHLPNLASSRGVPVIPVRDKKGGSLRLGALVKLKTAIAIGVKARGSGINKAIEEILCERVLTKDDEPQKDVELPFPSRQTI